MLSISKMIHNSCCGLTKKLSPLDISTKPRNVGTFRCPLVASDWIAAKGQS